MSFYLKHINGAHIKAHVIISIFHIDHNIMKDWKFFLIKSFYFETSWKRSRNSSKKTVFLTKNGKKQACSLYRGFIITERTMFTIFALIFAFIFFPLYSAMILKILIVFKTCFHMFFLLSIPKRLKNVEFMKNVAKN